MRHRRPGVSIALGCLALASAACAGWASDTPAPTGRRITLGAGVDTTDADTRAIVALVRAYFANPDSAKRPRALWSTSDSIDVKHGDLVADMLYLDGVKTDIAIAGVQSQDQGDSVYVVSLLHANVDREGTVFPFALQRVFAVRSTATPFGWALSNALQRRTARWTTHRAGRILFHYAPSMSPAPARAERTARWLDSIAEQFGVTPPASLDYYVTATPPEYFAAFGVDYTLLPSGRGSAVGGNAMTRQGIVLAGDRQQAEEYRHELVHMLFRDRFGGGAILGEGLPTWLGGSQGRDRWRLFALLREYQQARPNATLAALISGEVETGWGPSETTALYASGALFVEAIHRRGGIDSLRRMSRLPDEAPALMDAMRRALALDDSKDSLERWWRESAVAFTPPAGNHDSP